MITHLLVSEEQIGFEEIFIEGIGVAAHAADGLAPLPGLCVDVLAQQTERTLPVIQAPHRQVRRLPEPVLASQMRQHLQQMHTRFDC